MCLKRKGVLRCGDRSRNGGNYEGYFKNGAGFGRVGKVITVSDVAGVYHVIQRDWVASSIVDLGRCDVVWMEHFQLRLVLVQPLLFQCAPG